MRKRRGRGWRPRIAGWPGLAGSNPWMIVGINGHDLRAPELLNKPVEFTMLCGMDTTWVHGTRWRILYSPDFSDAVRKLKLPFAIPDCDPYHFVWDITRYIVPGQNEVRVTYLQLLTEGSTLVLGDVRVETGEPIKPAEQADVRPAPTGEVPAFVAGGAKPAAMDVQLSASGAIQVKVGGRARLCQSGTSQREGKWVGTDTERWAAVKRGGSGRGRWRGEGYDVARQVTVRADHLHVADTITNVGAQLVGVIYENRLALADKPRESGSAAGRRCRTRRSTPRPPTPPPWRAGMT